MTQTGTKTFDLSIGQTLHDGLCEKTVMKKHFQLMEFLASQIRTLNVIRENINSFLSDYI